MHEQSLHLKLASVLDRFGICYELYPFQVVCAKERWSNGLFGGPSVWVAHDGVSWILSTWTPRIYRYDRSEIDSVGTLIGETFRYCSLPLYDIPENVKEKYLLREVSEDDLMLEFNE